MAPENMPSIQVALDPAIGPLRYSAFWTLMAGSSPATTIESDESLSMRLAI
jgi:hypothetical protein